VVEMLSYRWLLFIVLFVGIFFTNHFAITAKEPLAASVTFVLMILSVYLLEKFYNRGPEKVSNERTDLIMVKSFYYGSIAFLVALMFELIWLASENNNTALLIGKYLMMPLGMLVVVAAVPKAYLERVI
jgi:hypothetical protein